ncbi:MAG: sodium:panthothenate symporter [Verrucomicrobiota bacterium]
MHWIDWIIVLIPLVIVVYIGIKSQRYIKGVSDFLAAGRVAGRYVIAVASGEAGMGLISLVAIFEMYYNSGFALGFWSTIAAPIGLIMGLTGFCIYRFRETRAMTMGQFFEMRYSKSFRIFAATLQSISGVINYALFPAVSARCLIYFCDLPLQVDILGMAFPTFGLLMAVFLGLAVFIIVLGGQITIMTTDCIQGILSYPMYLIIVIYIIYKFSWFDQIAPALLDRAAGKSMLNPYDIAQLRDFNLFYIFVGIFSNILNRMSWSGTQGYNAAAITPHEQKMSSILGSWRAGFSSMMFILLAVAAYTFLNHVDFARPAREVRTALAAKALNDVAGTEQFKDVRKDAGAYFETGQISPELQARMDKVKAMEQAEKQKEINTAVKSDEKAEAQPVAAVKDARPDREEMLHVVQTALKSEDKGAAVTFGTIFSQMRVPMALSAMLPVGITGLLCALMIFLMVSTDTTYMHAWGSIIVQDVILPFRRKPFTPRQQLLLLRLIITGVAVFAFLFSFFFGQIDFILMFFAITGAIWLGGAGPCIVLGLYWKRGTSAGAFGALISGAILAVGGILGQKYWAGLIYPWLLNHGMVEPVRTFLQTVSAPFNPYVVWTVNPDKFPINSQEIYFITMVVTLALYFGLSLLTSREVFNLDRMLHRGKYHREGKEVIREKLSFRSVFKRLIGIDSQYTTGDKVLAWSVFIWSFGWGFGSFITLIIWNKISPWPNNWWANWFFFCNFILAGILGMISTIWFTIGGTIDLNRLFKRLRESEFNVLDDGRVIGHISADDVVMVEQKDHIVIEEAHIEETALEQALAAEHDETDLKNLRKHEKE